MQKRVVSVYDPIIKEWIERDYSDKSEDAYYWLRDNIGRLLLVILFLCLGAWGLSLTGREGMGRGGELLVAIGPELAGIGIGVIAIDFFNERRQMQQLKTQLIRQMGMNIRDIAVPAARELAHHGWLFDGSLRGADLRGAVLSEARLGKANLSEADLWNATLSHTFLTGADLRNANMNYARLDNTDLRWAILTRAKLIRTDLNKSFLRRADLSGAKGWTIEQLGLAQSLEGAIMPDNVQLKDERHNDGPTFEEWKMHYLAKHGGTESDLRDVANKQDDND